MAFDAVLDHGPVRNNGHCDLALQGAAARKLVGVEAAHCSASVSDLPRGQPESLLEVGEGSIVTRRFENCWRKLVCVN